MKEPIRKIHLFADQLKARLAGKLEAEELQYFEPMERAARRMGILIEDLLTYSHVSKGVSLTESVDLNSVIQMVEDDMELAIEEKGAKLVNGRLPTIKGSRRQLQQMFENLIGNSLKYSSADKPPEISISAQLVKAGDIPLPVVAGDRMYHQILVRDNGIGFDQEDAERIFHVFIRLHGNAEYKGTGVGLSIVRKAAQNHGGEVWAEGIPGKGATFHVLLPAE